MQTVHDWCLIIGRLSSPSMNSLVTRKKNPTRCTVCSTLQGKKKTICDVTAPPNPSRVFAPPTGTALKRKKEKEKKTGSSSG